MTNKKALFTDESLLSELGTRIEQLRIRKDLTQAQLAKEAGIGKRTLERLESGESTQLTSFISVLRALGLIDPLLDLIPDQRQSPMAQLLQEERPRLRASGRGTETDGEWTWND